MFEIVLYAETVDVRIGDSLEYFAVCCFLHFFFVLLDIISSEASRVFTLPISCHNYLFGLLWNPDWALSLFLN